MLMHVDNYKKKRIVKSNKNECSKFKMFGRPLLLEHNIRPNFCLIFDSALRALITSKSEWIWEGSQQLAFETIKEDLFQPPVLALNSPTRAQLCHQMRQHMV